VQIQFESDSFPIGVHRRLSAANKPFLKVRAKPAQHYEPPINADERRFGAGGFELSNSFMERRLESLHE
jgi:hypothetical protein